MCWPICSTLRTVFDHLFHLYCIPFSPTTHFPHSRCDQPPNASPSANPSGLFERLILLSGLLQSFKPMLDTLLRRNGQTAATLFSSFDGVCFFLSGRPQVSAGPWRGYHRLKAVPAGCLRRLGRGQARCESGLEEDLRTCFRPTQRCVTASSHVQQPLSTSLRVHRPARYTYIYNVYGLLV